MQKWKCRVCGYVYDPEIGDLDRGLPAEVKFEELPENWTCPSCGVSKWMFDPL